MRPRTSRSSCSRTMASVANDLRNSRPTAPNGGGPASFPLLDGLPETESAIPSAEILALAAQSAQGLSADRVANPRQIKRFLNAYGVRSSAAAARGASLKPAVLIKLLLLEDQHPKSFERISGPDRPRRAHGAASPLGGLGGAATNSIRSVRPRRARMRTAQARRPQPRSQRRNLSLPASRMVLRRRLGTGLRPGPGSPQTPLGTYIDLAASLTNIAAAAFTSNVLITLVDELLGQNGPVREAAYTSLLELDDSDQSAAIDLTLQQAPLLQDVSTLLDMVLRWAGESDAVAPAVIAARLGNLAGRHTTGSCVEMGACRTFGKLSSRCCSNWPGRTTPTPWSGMLPKWPWNPDGHERGVRRERQAGLEGRA